MCVSPVLRSGDKGIAWGGGFFVFDMCVGINNVMCPRVM